jgi:hypothetical protein
MSKLPQTEEEGVERACALGFTEKDVRDALELQEAFGLLRRQFVGDLGFELLHNEYLWGHKIERIGPILAKLGRQETEGLLALMEEVRGAQGRPLDHISAAPRKIVALAAKTGILDTITVATAAGDQKLFSFTPHFFGYRAGQQPSLITDWADQVKLFVASITYGVHHSVDFRLHSPLLFVRKLLREGEAGDATPILRDYVLLERQGIVSVEERSNGKGTFVLRKADIVQQALDVMESGSLIGTGTGPNDVRTFVSQREFRTPEENRLTAGFGTQAGDTKRFDHDIMAAIREAAQRGTW